MPTSKTWPGGGTNTSPASFSIPASGELSWASLSDFLNALGDSAQATTFQKFAVRKATTTPVTVSATSDCVVVTQLASAGAVTVNLPAGANKQVFVIVDGTGDAATNTVTINRNGTDTIGGATSVTLTHNYEGVMLVYNSSDTDWKVIHLPNISAITSSDISGTIAPSKGGTGVANNNSATLTRSGNHALTLTTTNTTSVTLPTSGTLGAVPSAGGVYSDGSALQNIAFSANQVFGSNNGATAMEGKTISVGTSGTDFAVAHSANTITLNLPSASGSNRGAITTADQTLGGIKTFTDGVIAPTGRTSWSTSDNVGSGTYTPTSSSPSSNVTSNTPLTCYYMRVGNNVHVSGLITMTCNSTAEATIDISLPVSTTNCHAAGTIVAAGSAFIGGRVVTSGTTSKAQFDFFPQNSTLTWAFTFQYQIN